MPLPIRQTCSLAIVAACLIVGGCHPDSAFDTHVISVRLMAENRSWHASYLFPTIPGPAAELSTGREVHVPVGARVRLLLASRDFVSDFRVNGLGLREFAAPYFSSELTVEVTRPGRYEIRGDEMCGLPHTDRTRGWLVVEQKASYRSWITRRISEQRK